MAGWHGKNRLVRDGIFRSNEAVKFKGRFWDKTWEETQESPWPAIWYYIYFSMLFIQSRILNEIFL